MAGMALPRLARIVVIGRTVRRLLVTDLWLHVGIELPEPLGVTGERVNRHRAVDKHRQHGNPLLHLEPLQPVNELLDPTDRERRNDDPAAALRGAVDDIRQLRPLSSCSCTGCHTSTQPEVVCS